MGKKIEVLFGNSDIYPDTIIVRKAEVVGKHIDDEGNPFGTEYDSETESWMARTDMNCSIYSIPEKSFSDATETYTAFVKATQENQPDEEKINRYKKQFLALTTKS